MDHPINNYYIHAAKNCFKQDIDYSEIIKLENLEN